jgi:hypothetical protein
VKCYRILIHGLLAFAVSAQQSADRQFATSVAHPAYRASGPRVLFDEAHHNFHTTNGRYQPFAELIRNDGYSVTPNTQRFQPEVLRGYDILVIANAMGADTTGSYLARDVAFTAAECRAVEAWVRRGGSLFLIADHAPMGAAADILARRFGVRMAKGYTSDSNHFLAGTVPSIIVYSSEQGLARTHPITDGREPAERVTRVIAFTGQSLSVPRRATAILRLSATAIDVTLPRSGDAEAARMAARHGKAVPGGRRRSAAGQAQMVALTLGLGRVVIAGEAGMFTAQVLQGAAAREFGAETFPMGMNHPDCDNRQLALNVLHWLSRLI